MVQADLSHSGCRHQCILSELDRMNLLRLAEMAVSILRVRPKQLQVDRNVYYVDTGIQADLFLTLFLFSP